MTDDKIDYESMFNKTRAKPVKTLTRDEYPDARPKIRRWKKKGEIQESWYVSVSIPRPIRHLFNAPSKHLVAGKTEADYFRKRRSLTNEIYQEFDKRQEEYKEKNQANKEKFIKVLKDEFGESYKEYEKKGYEFVDANAENTLQHMISLFKSILPKKTKYQYTHEDKQFGTIISQLSTDVPFEELVQIKFRMDTTADMVRDDFTSYSMEQVNTVRAYLQKSIHTYFEDLIVDTAKKQNKQIPDFDEPDLWTEPLDGGSPIADFINRIDAHLKQELIETQNSERGRIIKTDKGYGINKGVEGVISRHGLEERPRMSGAVTMKTLRDDYLKWVEVNYKENSKATMNKLRQAFDEFIELMGDYEPKQIDSAMAVEFAEAQLERYPTRANKTISNRNWCMGVFCRDYAIVKRLMDSNPFYGAKLDKKGRKKVKTLEYTDEDLDIIFNYKWGEQELLLLKLGLSTGCRITELARLTWERIVQTNQGFTYLSLLDEIHGDHTEETSVKNLGSKRLVPLHPDLRLPVRATGQLFDYWLSSTSSDTGAGQAVSPTLNKLVAHPDKKFHSFRSSYIIKLQNTKIPTQIEKQITGHSSGDVHADTYSGSAVADRYEWIKKLDLPWLKMGEKK